MPQITKISPQKRKDRYNIFLDEKFAFGVSLTTLVSQSLKVGNKLDDEQIKKILKGEDFAKLFDSSLKILTLRPRSEKEIKDYLAQKIARSQNIKFRDARESLLIVQIVQKLRRLGFLNDLEFAKWWHSARTRQAKGPRLIKTELLQKGIDRETIENVLSSGTNPKTLAIKALEKKIKAWQKLPDDKSKQKIYTYLVARGFDWDTIKEAIAFYEKKG
ncbi:hypothetical protein A3A60_00255 [Candidatus Curtissbacteria bacterium RIFCSPLOWO2_01_FULL_42_26]|uniref:Regulatory protein RecX n=1 Tax=Candidatus Curtissbacteria bacterium RIFCSPLOWO2_01_FULL_42_26 TaxID=1797729 RepID=A0A1F5I2P1_9BACT|nr:MAG: hypothetical protein A3A60_00255 [Candidatus Curtissbacteria bacterium RIFCSPLOWO2_01_FULL_42_26]